MKRLLPLLFLFGGVAAEDVTLESLFNEGKYAAAVVMAEQLLEKNPKDQDLLYNGGLAAYLNKDYKASIRLFSRLKEIESASIQVRAKIIQAYQADNDMAKRDAEIRQLYTLYDGGKSDAYKETLFFTRDQFVVNTTKVMTFEFFALGGERPVKWKFQVLNEKGEINYVISVGSYDMTNGLMQSQKKLPEGDRYYHLDGYYNDGKSHRTFEFYEGLPKYDDIKKTVIQIIEKKVEAVSGTDAK